MGTDGRTGETVQTVGVPYRYITKEVTLAATTNYTKGDVLSNSASAGTYIEFANVVNSVGGSGRIVGAIIQAQNTQVAISPTLYLFTSAPTNANLNDNIANTAPHYSDSGYIGEINFPVFTYSGGGGKTEAVEGAGNLPKRFQCAEGATSLYGICKTEDDWTNEFAGEKFTFILFIEHNA